jgi:hypothetical protein
MNHTVLVAILLSLAAASAWAGRPLATDDAGTAELGTCQLESWLERAGSDRALVIAPACGVVAGVELGADYTLPKTRDVLRGAAGVAMKWVPESWQTDTPLGAMNFGIKLGAAFERPAGGNWRSSETGALALATLVPAENWVLHGNLGFAHERAGGQTAGLMNVAVTWAPQALALLFAETQANNRRAVFGNTVYTGGGRWWAVKDRVGLDLTASREATSGAQTVWTLGFGWYGLSF